MQWTCKAVSILVLVDAALRRYRFPLQCHNIEVSILVLVDAALRQLFKHSFIDIVISFNPCFSGCRPATRLC